MCELAYEASDLKQRSIVHPTTSKRQLLLSSSNNKKSLTEQDDDKQQHKQPATVLRYNIRYLALFTLGLLSCAHMLVLSECSYKEPTTITNYIVNTKTSNAIVRKNANTDSRPMGYLPPNTKVETIPFNSKSYVFAIEPITGYIARKSLILDEDEPEHIIDTFCPMSGFRLNGRNKTARYTYTPTNLVIAQQLWNALQVMELYLVISLFYLHYKKFFGSRTQWIAGGCITLFFLIMLPFSIYVISPGAVIFSLITFFTITFAIIQNKTITLNLGGEHKTNNNNNKNITTSNQDAISDIDDEENLLPKHDKAITSSVSSTSDVSSWSLTKEETLGFICNLCSSLYNYNASRYTWPHWDGMFRNIDKMFGWNGGEGKNLDVFYEEVYTLGMKDITIPTYVPRSTGSTFGSHLFLFLWSIIPFVYVSYYLCMYILAVKSPGVKVQRALLIFAMFHFLFMTDAVTYKYGRGFWSPHAETFHWFERWAWRIAVLMPIYQNCTSGHWKHGHTRFPIVGVIFHYAVACWGILFFLLQIIASDVVRFYEYIYDMGDMTLFQILGIRSPGIDGMKPFSYHGALVIMWSMYLFLLISGFTTCSVKMTSEEQQKQSVRNNNMKWNLKLFLSSAMNVLMKNLVQIKAAMKTTTNIENSMDDSTIQNSLIRRRKSVKQSYSDDV